MAGIAKYNLETRREFCRWKLETGTSGETTKTDDDEIIHVAGEDGGRYQGITSGVSLSGRKVSH